MPKTPYYHQREARQQNTSTVLRDLWRSAPLSKAMLAHRNGLTKATVAAICADLEGQGLIRYSGQDRTGLGRPGDLIELNPLARCAIGVEISTNYVAILLADLCGRPLWRNSASIEVGSSQEVVLASAETLIAGAMEQASQRGIALLGVGVAVPGIVDPSQGDCVSVSALRWKEVPLKQIWVQRFALPVIVENKARAAAMAEAYSGSAHDAANFIYISLGTGVHSSIEAAAVTGGIPWRGSRGLALDAGHMILDPQGPLCSCGQPGCWQAMVDVEREVEIARVRLAAGEPSVLQTQHADGYARLEHRAIHQAALEGDPLALDVLRTVQSNHTLGIVNLVRLFDPDLVVIGWASAALPDTYHARMKTLHDLLDVPGAVREQLARRGARPPEIVLAAHGRDACTLGAAALLVEYFLRMPPVAGEVNLSQQPQAPGLGPARR